MYTCYSRFQSQFSRKEKGKFLSPEEKDEKIDDVVERSRYLWYKEWFQFLDTFYNED